MTRDEKYRKTREKNRAYRTRRALRIIRKAQPKTVEAAQAALGMACREIGQGAFRTAYHIYGTTLLIKFPLSCRYKIREVEGGEEVWSDAEGKNHSRMEVKKIRALLEFPMWRKHLPPIYYFNGRDGVIVTKYYRRSDKFSTEFARNILIGELVREFCNVILGDITEDNIREFESHLVLIDLGY
jgi:hypothetical protein